MGPRQKVLVTAGVVIFLLVGFTLITYSITKFTGYSVSQDAKYNDYDLCLQEQDITLYINSDNSAETLNGIRLFNYLHNFKIFNCLRNNQVCLDNNVNTFPTWIINGNKIEHDIAISELSEFSGCKAD